MNNEMNNGLGPNTMPTPEQPVQSVPTAPVAPTPVVAPVAPQPVAQPVQPAAPVQPEPMPATAAPVEPAPMPAPTPVPAAPVEPVQQPVTPQPVPTPVPTPVDTPAVPPMEPPTTPPQNDVVENTPEEKPKKKSKILLIIPIIIAVLGILGFVGFKVLLNDKAVMKLEVKLLSKGANTALDALIKKAEAGDEKAVTGYKGTLTLESDYQEDGIDLSKLKNYQLNYTYVSDPVKNQMSAHATLTNQTIPVVDVQTLVDKDTAYVSLGDLLNKVIKMDASELRLDQTQDNVESLKATQTLINKTEPIIVNFIDKQEFTKSKEEKEINGNSKKYNKVSVEFNMAELEKFIYSAYVEDDEVIKALSTLSGEEEKAIKESLTTSLNNADTENGTKVTLNTYKTTFATNADEMEIIIDSDSENPTKIVIDTLKDESQYHIYVGDTELYSGTFTDETITFKDAAETMTATLTIKEDEFSGNFNYNVEGMGIQTTFESTTKDDVTNTTVNATIKYGETAYNFTLKNKLEKVSDAKIEELDTSTAVGMEELTEMDMYMLQQAYQQKLSLLLYDFMTVQYRIDNNILQ